jgi:hypothetical protein
MPETSIYESNFFIGHGPIAGPNFASLRSVPVPPLLQDVTRPLPVC